MVFAPVVPLGIRMAPSSAPPLPKVKPPGRFRVVAALGAPKRIDFTLAAAVVAVKPLLVVTWSAGNQVEGSSFATSPVYRVTFFEASSIAKLVTVPAVVPKVAHGPTMLPDAPITPAPV